MEMEAFHMMETEHPWDGASYGTEGAQPPRWVLPLVVACQRGGCPGLCCACLCYCMVSYFLIVNKSGLETVLNALPPVQGFAPACANRMVGALRTAPHSALLASQLLELSGYTLDSIQPWKSLITAP